jgi:hypothetical protein
LKSFTDQRNTIAGRITKNKNNITRISSTLESKLKTLNSIGKILKEITTNCKLQNNTSTSQVEDHNINTIKSNNDRTSAMSDDTNRFNSSNQINSTNNQFNSNNQIDASNVQLKEKAIPETCPNKGKITWYLSNRKAFSIVNTVPNQQENVVKSQKFNVSKISTPINHKIGKSDSQESDEENELFNSYLNNQSAIKSDDYQKITINDSGLDISTKSDASKVSVSIKKTNIDNALAGSQENEVTTNIELQVTETKDDIAKESISSHNINNNNSINVSPNAKVSADNVSDDTTKKNVGVNDTKKKNKIISKK